MVGHNANGFDNYFVMSSLPSSYKSIKKFIISRVLSKLSFRAGYVMEGDRDIPKSLKIVSSKCHIPGSVKSTQKQYNIQSK